MNIFDTWKFWVVLYLFFAVVFAQTFKKANRNMKNASALTVLLELSTAAFAILFIPLFKFEMPNDLSIYFTLLLVVAIYAITDRLNIEARFGLDPSTFSMLKQLSTVFMIIFGFLFLKEQVLINKVFGSIIIIIANILLTCDKGKIKINKYFIMSFVSNFLFAIAMIINVNIADNFNLGIYTIITVSVPAIIISIFSKLSISKLKEEFLLYDKFSFLIADFSWCVMLISSVRAYQLGSVTIVASLFSLTSIINTIVEFIINKNTNKFIQKLIAAILIVIGVILVRI